MNLYQKNGYVDMGKIFSLPVNNIFAHGARGIGKTEGTFIECVDSGKPFIFMRRTSTELEFLASNDQCNPFAFTNNKLGCDIKLHKIPGNKYMLNIVDESADDLVGIAFSLSSAANIRSFNASPFQILFYDEFIPEPHVRLIKNESSALFNCIETIARNREFSGGVPLKVFCASNANRLDNPIYMGLGVVQKVVEMKKRKQELSVMPDRDMALINFEHCPISELKRNTSLYKLTQGTGFDDMALSNKFVGEHEDNRIKPQPLRDYNPVATIGEITIYEHKSENRYYVTYHKSGTVPEYQMTTIDKKAFFRGYAKVWIAYLHRKVFFETREVQIFFENAFDT